jgi:hypothetical protein
MAVPSGESPWKIAVGAVILMVFVYIGIAHAIDPERFLKRSGIRKGGEMLTEFNRLGFRIAGLLFAAFAGCLLYVLASDVLGK